MNPKISKLLWNKNIYTDIQKIIFNYHQNDIFILETKTVDHYICYGENYNGYQAINPIVNGMTRMIIKEIELKMNPKLRKKIESQNIRNSFNSYYTPQTEIPKTTEEYNYDCRKIINKIFGISFPSIQITYNEIEDSKDPKKYSIVHYINEYIYIPANEKINIEIELKQKNYRINHIALIGDAKAFVQPYYYGAKIDMDEYEGYVRLKIHYTNEPVE